MNPDNRTTVHEVRSLWDAPKHSREYAIAVHNRIVAALSSGIIDGVIEATAEISAHETWKHLRDDLGRPFASLTAYVTHPRPRGLGWNMDSWRRLAADLDSPAEVAARAPELREHGANQHVEASGGVDNVNSSEAKGGNRNDYLAARLKRDHPDIHERLAAGEYRSVRAAAIDAGIVRPQKTYVGEPRERVTKALRDLEPGEAVEPVADFINGLPPDVRQAILTRITGELFA